MNQTALSFQHNQLNRRNSHGANLKSVVPVSTNNDDAKTNKKDHPYIDQFDLVNSLLDKVLLNGMAGIRAAITIAKSLVVYMLDYVIYLFTHLKTTTGRRRVWIKIAY